MSAWWNIIHRIRTGCILSGFLLAPACASFVSAEDVADGRTSARTARPAPRMLLTPEQWAKADRAVDRGLVFLAKNQQTDGSFPTAACAQPGVTSLCLLAFLARGHQSGKGPYGKVIERGIDYVLGLQHPQTGAIMAPRFVGGNVENASNYSHGISGVMLAEVYGVTDPKTHERIGAAIVKALDYTRRQQNIRKWNPGDQGGWRYVGRAESDLSVTAWQLMFLRSARNAEFNVPKEWAKEAMDYVHRSFDVNQRAFVYGLNGGDRYATRGLVGAGIVCLELGGEHQSETAKIAGDWILRSTFVPYNNKFHIEDRYHYGAFYCAQAMFQLGGKYWDRFFPQLLNVMSEAQHADGSWDLESIEEDQIFGQCYTTSLSVLALATPYQLLPIYQR